MKKIIAGLALSLGLVMPLSPATATTPDPEAPSANPQCQGATNRICGYLFDWAHLVQSLEATIADQQATITAQQEKIVAKRATIERLRAKLAHRH